MRPAIPMALLMAACVLCAPAATLAAEMAASFDREKVYLGTQALLVVEVTDPQSSEWPTVAPVEGLQIAPYGGPTTMRDLFRGTTTRSYRFVVTPMRAGEFIIPSVTLGSGQNMLRCGPLTLLVEEVPITFLSVRVEPPQICPGETARLTVIYQGVAQGEDLVVPTVEGLTLRVAGVPRVEILRAQGTPVSIYEVEVGGTHNGKYSIEGITLAGVRADVVTLEVTPIVISDAQVTESSLVVGGQTLVHILVRGLTQAEQVSLVLPPGLKAQRSRQQYQGPPGTTVFSFEVTADEPGSLTIGEIQLADRRKIVLPKPVVLSVRRDGHGDILACRGTVRGGETVVGEPFFVDYEVFFRGDLQAAGVDMSQADFASRPYIKVEPVTDLSYEGWQGQPMLVRFGQHGEIVLLSGSGELDGEKEQMLRFALKVTPLAAGQIDLKGVRIVLRLLEKQEQRSIGAFFSSTRMQDHSRTIDVPAHRVVDPPGKTPPAGYRGAVGTAFTYTTSLDRTTATAMAPLTLTMTIRGDGVGPQMPPPPLAEVPELSRDFEISPTTSGGDVQDNTITFTQVVRPRSESVKELPALPLVYYDYVKKSYETVYSLPIPITVTPGSVVGATAMQTGGVAEPASGESAVEGAATEPVALGANYPTLGRLHGRAPLGLAGVVAVLVAGPVAIGGAWLGRKLYERRRPLAQLRQQRRELADALGRAGEREDFYVHLADLVQSYLRLTFALPAGEISADALARAMDRKGVDAGLRCEIENLLATCDSGRFAPGQTNEAERSRLVEQTRRLFERLERV